MWMISVTPPCHETVCGWGNGSLLSSPTCMIRILNTCLGSRSARSSCARAIALDSGEPSGKSPGLSRLFIYGHTHPSRKFQGAVAVLAGPGLDPPSSPDLIKACTAASLLGSLCFGHLQTQPSGPFSIASFGTNSGRSLSITPNPVKKHAPQW